MQTSKLISTISYNTPSFLAGRLRSLVSSAVIEYAHWIIHEPEEDETKSHIHVVLKPNRRLDTSALRNEFVEMVQGEDKPRLVLPFRTTSRISDWILYSVHDAVYLLQKNEQRKYHYERKDLSSTDDDMLDEDWRECHRCGDNRIPTLKRMAEEGFKWEDVIMSGLIPINHLFQYKEIFYSLKGGTSRGGRLGHDEM